MQPHRSRPPRHAGTGTLVTHVREFRAALEAADHSRHGIDGLTVAHWRTARRALSGAARRYLDAEARGASLRHLTVLLDAWTARVQDALAAGLRPVEVGQAAGIVPTAPTWLGLDDLDVVEEELAHRLVRSAS